MNDKNKGPEMNMDSMALMIRKQLDAKGLNRCNIITRNGAHIDNVKILEIGSESLLIEAAGEHKVQQLSAISTIEI